MSTVGTTHILTACRHLPVKMSRADGS